VKPINRRVALLGLSATALSVMGTASFAAEDFDDPAAKVIAVRHGEGRTTVFSRDDLASLKQTRFETMAPWIETPSVFEGPSIAELMRAIAPREEFDQVEISALDSYFVSAKVPHLVDDGAILAIRTDGAFMPVAEKGPVLLIFPFDDRPGLNDQSHFGLCIWQISQIDFS